MPSSNHYSEHFAGEAAASEYVKKFTSSIDVMRHEIERNAISAHAHGNLFDCSIATGRLIGLLPKVTNYSGMDYSKPFLSHIRAHYPDVNVQWGDLTKGIEKPSEAFDTVICIRTLFALPGVDQILKDMVRITKPSGTIIFDYGVKATDVNFGGALLQTSHFDIQGLLRILPVSVVDVIPLDSPIIKLKNVRLARKFIGLALRSKMLSKGLIKLEGQLASRSSERRLYVLRKI